MQCFKCEKLLKKVFEDDERRPDKACTFTTHGQWGSAAFDPIGMTGEYLSINICDDCLLANREKVTLFVPARQPDFIPPHAFAWEEENQKIGRLPFFTPPASKKE